MTKPLAERRMKLFSPASMVSTIARTFATFAEFIEGGKPNADDTKAILGPKQFPRPQVLHPAELGKVRLDQLGCRESTDIITRMPRELQEDVFRKTVVNVLELCQRF